MEADKIKKEKFLEEISKIDPSTIVYIDESGVDEGICSDRGWSKKGKPLLAKKIGKYYVRTNIIAGLVNNKSIAPTVFNGTCNTEFFNRWVEKILLPELKAGQTVIMDNAAFHKSKKTRELIESAHCKLIFLPPYSPDLNPIEKFWANMKRWLKQKINNFTNLYDAFCSFFQYT